MQPALPNGFHSWAQVFTDWRVSRAFSASPRPQCFGDQPELAAPFVAAVSAEIRDRQLRRRPVELPIRRTSVVEPTYDRAGGPAYVALRLKMEAAQERYIARHRASPPAAAHRVPGALRADMERLQSEFHAFRERLASAVAQAQFASRQDYWRKHPPRSMDDAFFASSDSSSVPARMSRIEPAWWWRSFFTRLQQEFANFHSADGCLLDVIPELRTRARTKTLEALVTEWGEACADQWGWDGPGHYRMLANRAGPKAKKIAGWFNQCAPGYLSDRNIRRSLDDRLSALLTEHDPLSKLLPTERNVPGADWLN